MCHFLTESFGFLTPFVSVFYNADIGNVFYNFVNSWPWNPAF